MNSRSINLAQLLSVSFFLFVVLIPWEVRGQGSISFNGSTSKIQNDTASLLEDSDEITICAWIFAATMGEGNAGFLAAISLEPGTASGCWVQCDSSSRLAFVANFGTSDGSWAVPLTTGIWIPVAISYSKENYTEVPNFRMNFAAVSPIPILNPNGTFPTFSNPGYCVGNFTDQNFTWNGRIAHVQVFNRVLSPAEMDACLQVPGSVRNGLRLWLPMTHASDTSDASGNGFHGMGTDLIAGLDEPPAYIHDGVYTVNSPIIIPLDGGLPGRNAWHVAPSRHLLGQSSSLTELKANMATLTGAVVKTENYGTTATHRAIIANLAIDGAYDMPTNMEQYYPRAFTADVASGIQFDGTGGLITNCHITQCKGEAIEIRRTTGGGDPHRMPMNRIVDIDIVTCFKGIYIYQGANDNLIDRCYVYAVRDYGLWTEGGATQVSNCHFFGAQAAAVKFSFTNSSMVNTVFSDSPIGWLNIAPQSRCDSGYSQHCWSRNIKLNGQTQVSDTIVKVAQTTTNHQPSNYTPPLDDGSAEGGPIVGVLLTQNASNSSFTGGAIYVDSHRWATGNQPPDDFEVPILGSVGVKIEGAANAIKIDTVILDDYSVPDSKGVHIAGASSGLEITIHAWGFDDTGDRIVDFDSPLIKGCKVNIFIHQATQTSVNNCVEIPANWDNTNEIIIHWDGDSTSGAGKTKLTAGLAYPRP
jgi:hypothetical protein